MITIITEQNINILLYNVMMIKKISKGERRKQEGDMERILFLQSRLIYIALTYNTQVYKVDSNLLNVFIMLEKYLRK